MAGIKQIVKGAILGKERTKRKVLLGPGRGIRIIADPAYDSQRLVGLAEAELNADFVRFAKRAGAFVDIGASNGYYCFLVHKHNSSADLIACEPQAYLKEEFEENLSANGFDRTRFTFVPALVGSDGVTVDELLKGRATPYFLKIDVEGAEADVLMSGSEVLAKADCVMIIETHSVKAEADCIGMLSAWGYVTRVVDKAWYRAFLPEVRTLSHNRWLIVERP
jgi:hypothetical protein